MKLHLPSVSAFLLGASFVVGGIIACDGPFSDDDGAEFETDCRQVCEEYKDCYDVDFDADACTSECIDESVNSASFRDSVDDCEECMDDESCLAQSFTCNSECSGVIDEST
ncbi:MAG TPA: hypothetical protein VGF99_03300 [Myxococcota bacterium]